MTTQIYKTLGSIGLKKNQVRALLPAWWDDGVAKTDAGAWELALLLARRLSLDAAALLHGKLQPTGAVQSLAFKHRRALTLEQLQPGSLIAASLAQAILAATKSDFRLPDDNAGALRNIIRNRSNGRIDFDALLNFCWDCGIPVIPLPNLPVGIRKMDGAIIQIGGRPVIVISRRQDSRSWLSFILAHELGHFCRRHLKGDSAIVDVALQTSATYQAESTDDTQEREADQFALDLLGSADLDACIEKWNANAAGVELAVQARELAEQTGTAAGHLVLRHAFRSKRWQEAQMALRFLAEDFDAQKALVTKLAASINLGAISEDLRDLVSEITGIE